MIRTLRLALLLACCSAALAQPLYKWTEADGSITFSPNKPEKGVEFQIINAAQGVTGSKIAIRDAKRATENSTQNLLNANSKQISFSSETPLQPVASSKALPTASSIGLIEGSSLTVDSAGSNPRQKALMSTKVQKHTTNRLSPSTAASSATQKQNHCEELRKRVVSLERSLKSTLTPEDMDNTIVHMSRYQKSYDQFCVQ